MRICTVDNESATSSATRSFEVLLKMNAMDLIPANFCQHTAFGVCVI